MASQMTHIVLADKLYERYFTHFDKKDFYVGNIYPDIRKMAGFNRELTHLQISSIEEVQSQANAFTAGMLLHNLIDTRREAFVRQSGVYAYIKITYSPQTVIKLLEDEIYYPLLANWHAIINLIDQPIKEERAYPVDDDLLAAWHKNLKDYFAQRPSAKTRQPYVKKLAGLDDHWWEEAEKCLAELRKSSLALTTAQELYDNIETIVR